MSLLYKYTQAMFGDAYGVCSITLRPFCIGHIFLLVNRKNPIITGEGDILLKHLLEAVTICSKTFEDGLEFIKMSDADKIIHYENIWKVILKQYDDINPFIFEKQLDLFCDYVKANSFEPKYVPAESNELDSAADGTPGLQSLKLVGMKMGYSLTEVMNMPFSGLIHDCIWHGRNTGTIQRLFTEDEVEMIEQFEKK